MNLNIKNHKAFMWGKALPPTLRSGKDLTKMKIAHKSN
jgi:hypothetical protein